MGINYRNPEDSSLPVHVEQLPRLQLFRVRDVHSLW